MSHDYDPSWDYEVIELGDEDSLTAQDKGGISDVIVHTRETLEKKFGFEEPCKVFFAKDLRGAVAVFIDGTSGQPILGFDVASMNQVCEEEGLGFVHQFQISLANVMAHAYMESVAGSSEEEKEARSQAAEEFARDWADYRDDSLEVLDRACGAGHQGFSHGVSA